MAPPTEISFRTPTRHKAGLRADYRLVNADDNLVLRGTGFGGQSLVNQTFWWASPNETLWALLDEVKSSYLQIPANTLSFGHTYALILHAEAFTDTQVRVTCWPTILFRNIYRGMDETASHVEPPNTAPTLLRLARSYPMQESPIGRASLSTPLIA